MEENQGYVIRQSVLFDNGRGFALGEHPREGFVTWQFTQEGNRRDYYWGHYYDDGAAAEKDYADRAADYQRRFHVREVKAPNKTNDIGSASTFLPLDSTYRA